MRDSRKLARLGAAALVLAGFALAVKAAVLPEVPRAEAAPAPGFGPGFPAFQNAQVFPMGDDINANGMPMRLGYFYTRGTPREVGEYYDTLWRKQGLSVNSVGNNEGVSVSAYDTRSGEMRNATVKKKGEHTYVFCSVSDLARGQEPEQAGEVVPLPEEGSMAQRTVVREGGRASHTLTFVAVRPVEQEMSRVDESFTQGGWKRSGELTKVANGGLIREYGLGPRTAQVVVAPTSEQGVVAVQVNATEFEAEAAQ